MNNKQKKFTELAIQDYKYSQEVSKWSLKELGDHIIQEIWSKEKFGTLNVAVLDRVINELFKLDENSKQNFKN